jgi:N-acetyl-anhydromuramyl-L-alanine amidase AmpD
VRRVERHSSPNHSPGRDGCRPEAIVLHTNVGGFDGTLDWFSRPESGVSAHYLVGLDGRVAQIVDEEDTARHAGRVQQPTAVVVQGRDESPNLFTIGIEFEDGGDPDGVARPDAQYAAGAALVADIAGRWSIPLDRDHVIGHREIFAAKACPGNLDIDRVIREASAP